MWIWTLSLANCGKYLYYIFTVSVICVTYFLCNADLQEGRDPDYSEYKEFKLTVENLGFRMLMKMGWKEGEGLGSDGKGIKAPVNK